LHVLLFLDILTFLRLDPLLQSLSLFCIAFDFIDRFSFAYQLHVSFRLSCLTIVISLGFNMFDLFMKHLETIVTLSDITCGRIRRNIAKSTDLLGGDEGTVHAAGTTLDIVLVRLKHRGLCH
jgi:hypothetical protein